jgi:hypothetical protein
LVPTFPSNLPLVILAGLAKIRQSPLPGKPMQRGLRYNEFTNNLADY